MLWKYTVNENDLTKPTEFKNIDDALAFVYGKVHLKPNCGFSFTIDKVELKEGK